MSHIFDALQRSEAERSGIEPDAFSLATELLQTAEPETPAPVAQPEAPMSLAESLTLLSQTSDVNQGAGDVLNPFSQFESLPVSILPNSRLVSVTEKESLAAEKFRFLAVRLRQLQQSRTLKKVLITSTIPEEGKTMVAVNLACTLARRRQQKTLLLEGDLRRPTISRQLGLGRIAGLSESLQNGAATTMNIYRLDSLGLWILPAGSAPQNPLELMQSGKLALFMEQLTTWFDWIVIDSPPVLPLADTSIWARLADGILLVTRQGTTEKQQLQRGLEAFEPAKLLGALLNSSVNTPHSNYYQRYGPAAVARENAGSRKEIESEANV